MKRLAFCLSAAVLLAPVAMAQSAPPPQLLQQALASPSKANLFAFDFVDVIEGSRTGFIRGRIDPARPKGDRVTLFEVTGEDSVKKVDERYEKNADGDIWCDHLSSGVDGPVTDRGLQPHGWLYAFTPKAKADASGDEKKLFKQLIAEVVIDPATARLKSFTATLPKPWKPNLLAKLNNVEMLGQCALAPDGRAYQVETTMKLSGSALGSDFSQTIRRTVTNLTPTTPAG